MPADGVPEQCTPEGRGQGTLASGAEPESPVSVVPPVAPAPPAPPALGSNFAFVQAAVQTKRAAKQLDRRRGYLMSQSSGATAPWRAGFCHRMLRKATRVLRTPTKIHRRLRKLSIGSFDARHPKPIFQTIHDGVPDLASQTQAYRSPPSRPVGRRGRAHCLHGQWDLGRRLPAPR